jgi:riboflavin kinase/FMN adenylyltransferase
MLAVATQLIRGLRNLPADFPGCVATIGNFDGVHLGHQALLAEVKKHAKKLGVPSVVITFEPHPGEFFGQNPMLPRLTRWREKFKALSDCGIDKVVLLRFNREFANDSAENFMRRILVEGLRIKHIVVGEDFRFGKARQGDFHFLKNSGEKYGFTAATLSDVMVRGERVSSTRIRKALAAGDHQLATELLGHPYTMRGRIVHGDKRGRQLGFPTANIDLHRKASPIQGIYIVRLYGLGDAGLPGVANIGTRPSVDGVRSLLEVHVFNFNQDIYGKAVCVEFCKKLRDEERYENLDLLKQQIEKDAAAARRYFLESGELSS